MDKKHDRMSHRNWAMSAYGTIVPPLMRTMGAVNMDSTRKMVKKEPNV